MLRCGNNGGTGVVLPDGRLSGFLDVPGEKGRVEIKRGQAVGIVNVNYKKSPPLTFYVRNGEWFIGVLALFFAALSTAAAVNFLSYCKKLPESSAVLKKHA